MRTRKTHQVINYQVRFTLPVAQSVVPTLRSMDRVNQGQGGGVLGVSGNFPVFSGLYQATEVALHGNLCACGKLFMRGRD